MFRPRPWPGRLVTPLARARVEVLSLVDLQGRPSPPWFRLPLTCSSALSPERNAYLQHHVARGLCRFYRHTPTSRGPDGCSGTKTATETTTRAKARSAHERADGRRWNRESDSQVRPKASSHDHQLREDKRGRLLTTPTRLLKLVLPMPSPSELGQRSAGQQGVPDERLALLIHPQQPLSYLEKLIQAEVPPLQVGGREKLPDVVFWAEAGEGLNEDGRQKDGSTKVASYSGLGREGPEKKGERQWVRWSSSTEVGDFIRDAARGREFAIAIQGQADEVWVAVPSFKDRTHYMRQRLRRMSRQMEEMSRVKRECDTVAYKGAYRLAQGGFGLLTGWWAIVYYMTFHTEAGWDLVEPVTYLAGLTTIMGGYLWFLFISRDLSYRAAMKVTISRRREALYQERGFDEGRWRQLAREANTLRADIKRAAAEYDADWDEVKDLGGEEVKEALEREEKKGGGMKEVDDDEDTADEAKRKEEETKQGEKGDAEEKKQK